MDPMGMEFGIGGASWLPVPEKSWVLGGCFCCLKGFSFSKNVS